MKLFLTLVFSFFAFSVMASVNETRIHCTTKYGKVITLDIEVTDRQNYQIRVTEDMTRQIPVHQQKIEFSIEGEIYGIVAAGGIEYVRVNRNSGEWTGEYWYDNAFYPLNCNLL